MFVSLQIKLELKREDKEKLIKLMRKQSSAIHVAYNCSLVSSEGSSPLPYPWTSSTKGFVPSEASVDGRGVG
jgi:hypothetical protein